MTDEKGKATMLDLAHGHGGSVAGAVASHNLEPLLQELIKAVRSISIAVNVPPAGAPDVCVAAPIVNVDNADLIEAVRETWQQQPATVPCAAAIPAPQPAKWASILCAIMLIFGTFDCVLLGYFLIEQRPT